MIDHGNKKTQILAGMSDFIDGWKSDSDFEDDQLGERKLDISMVTVRSQKPCWF